MALLQTPAVSDFLSAMFEAASEGLCLVGPDGTVIRANEKWLRATGLRAEQVVGADIIELFPETRDFSRALHARARAGERVVVPRHRQVILGDETWWDGSLAPVAMEGGVGILITARQLPPPAIAQATAALAALQVGVFVRSADGVIVWSNPAARALLELDEDQLARRRPRPAGWGTFFEDGRATEDVPVDERRRLRASPGDRVRIVFPDGRHRWVAKTTSRLVTEDDPGATLTTIVDVTHDVQSSDAALQRAREHQVAKRLNDMELVIRPDGRILEANDRALAAYGYTREEFLALNILDLRIDGQRTVPPQMIQDQDFGLRFETIHRRKDGTTFPVEVSSRTFEVNGERFLHGIVRDLTERRDAERAVRERQDLLDTYFRTPAIGIAFAEKGRGVLEANPTFCAMLGYSLEELRGMDWRRITHPDDVAQEEEAAGKLIRGEVESYALEKRYVRKDGTTFWGLLSLSGTRDEATGRVKVLGLVKDIEQRKRAVLALEESERRFRAMADGVTAHIAEFDGPGSVAWVNRSWLEFTGLTQDEVKGDGWRRSLHPDDLHLDADARRAAADGQPGFVFTCRMRGADGSYRSFRGHTRFMRSATGEVTALHTAFDVSDELAARERAEALSRELDTLLQTAQVGICKVVGRKQVWVNRRMEVMFGYPREELTGQPTRVVYPSDAAWEAFGREAYAALAAGRGVQVDQELVRKDGTRFWARCSGMAIDPGDLAQGTLWVVEDVTEQRHQRELLAASERRYRSLFENLCEDVSVFEVERDAEGRPMDWILMESNARARASGGNVDHLGHRLTQLAGPGSARYVQRTDAILAGEIRASEVFVPSLSKHYLASAFRLDEKTIVTAAMDITDRVAAEEALKEQSARNARTVEELKDALDHVKTLKGLLPICMHCKKIRDDKGYWDRLEDYITDRTEAEFSHGLCPDCQAKYYPDG